MEKVDQSNGKAQFVSFSRALAQLHSVALEFENGEINFSHFNFYELQPKFEMFCHLKDCLGECDSYPMEDESFSDPDHLTGSLADDLTDIYFELKWGLEQLDEHGESSQGRVLKKWQSSYLLHWGQHLVDAQRQLYRLRVDSLF